MELNVNPALLGLMTLLFAVGSFLLWKVFWKPLVDIMERREASIKEDLSKAEKARLDIENMKIAYTMKLREINRKTEEIIEQVKVEAKKRAQQLEESTHREIRREKERALAELEMERRRAIKALHDDVTSLALDAARAVLEREVNEDDHKRFVEEFIANIDK